LQARSQPVKHSFLWIAVVLVIIWIIAKTVLAVTSVALHLLWVLAIVALVIWLFGRVSSRT
jgi:hypothetical protein